MFRLLAPLRCGIIVARTLHVFALHIGYGKNMLL